MLRTGKSLRAAWMDTAPSAVHSLRLPRAWGGQPCSFGKQTRKTIRRQERTRTNLQQTTTECSCQMQPVKMRSGRWEAVCHWSITWASARCRIVRTFGGTLSCTANGGTTWTIKMALRCPLSTTMERVYALGDATAEGHRVAESLGGRSLKDVPHLGNLMTSFEGRSYVPWKSRHGVYMLSLTMIFIAMNYM